jgi:hypothetical protein
MDRAAHGENEVRLIPALLVASAVAAALAAPAASRERELRPVPPTIIAKPLAIAVAGFDTDGDMLVSRSEYDAGVARSFQFGDRNRDGAMGLIEFTAWSEAVLGNPGTVPGPFDFDKDGDDRISKVEFESLFATRHSEMDRNKDAAIGRSELVTAMTFQPPRRGRRYDQGYWREEQETPAPTP